MKPGDLVRHKGTGEYPQLQGHYGLVQVNRRFSRDDIIPLGVEWDVDPCEVGLTIPGHSLYGLLQGTRATCGWYVSPDDVEVVI